MTDKPDGKRWSWGTVAWTAVAILVLYLLSIGPAALLFVKTGYGGWYFARGCWPLHQVARIEVPGRMIERYMNFWLPGAGVGIARQNSKSGIFLVYKRDGELRVINH
jgi:hypothetical protein